MLQKSGISCLFICVKIFFVIVFGRLPDSKNYSEMFGLILRAIE